MRPGSRTLFIYLLPFSLLVTTGAVFYLLSKYTGKQVGYFSGFLFYWLFWCIIIPFILIGYRSILQLFNTQTSFFGKYKIRNIIFLVLPLMLVYSYEFPKVLEEANAIILLSSLAISIVNATAEEILWRGTFFKILNKNPGAFVLFSSFGFAVWHFAPQIVFNNRQPGGALSFVAVAFILGLLYSSVVNDTKSILLTTLAHILFDFAGLGGRIYF